MTTIKDILNSKKFLAAFVASGMLAFGQFFPAWAEYGDAIRALAAIDWQVVAGPILVAIGAQGIADFGKEKEKVKNGLTKLQGFVDQSAADVEKAMALTTQAIQDSKAKE